MSVNPLDSEVYNNQERTPDSLSLLSSRACDVCRTKKIRCDILIQPMPTDGTAPGPNTSADHPQGLCKHCKQQKLECTL